MHDALVTYLSGQRQASLLLTGIGVLGLAAAAIFAQSRWGLRGFAITLAACALFDIAFGVFFYLRASGQLTTLLRELALNVDRFIATEGTRMGTVHANFVRVNYVWFAVTVTAAAVALLNKSRPRVLDIALGILVNASILLAGDLMGERRAAKYVTAIEMRRLRT